MEIKEVLVIQKSPEALTKLNENNKTINENSDGKKSNVVMGGVFTEFNKINENERIYTEEGFIPHYEKLKEEIKSKGGVPGEYDHPPVFEMSLKNLSHFIEDINYNKNNQNITGKIRLTNTFYGKEAQSLVEDGFPLFVSSRAAGSVNPDKTVSIHQLFTYDLVAKPGFSSARMNMYESEMKKYESLKNQINESKLVRKEAKAQYDILFESFSNYQDLKNDKILLKKSNITPSLNLNDKDVKIYDLLNLSQTNELFEMNNNDFITKRDLELFQEHLNQKLNVLNKKIKNNKLSPSEIKESIDSLMEQQNKIASYLDYLSEETQVSYNKILNRTNKSSKGIKNLTEKVDKSIEYSNYIGENANDLIEHNNYIANELTQNSMATNRLIKENKKMNQKINNINEYQNYIVNEMNNNIGLFEKKLDKIIQYSDYLAENLQTSVNNNEYLKEYLNKNLNYVDYIAEKLEQVIEHGNYLAEHLNNNIKYSEFNQEMIGLIKEHNNYITGNMNIMIDYKNYLSENLEILARSTDDNFAKLDEKLNENLFTNFEKYRDNVKAINEKANNEKEIKNKKINSNTSNNALKEGIKIGDWITITGTKKKGKVVELKEETVIYKNIKTKVNEEINISLVSVIEKEKTEDSKVNNLIKEANKQKASNKKEDLHFLNLLSEEQKNNFNSLTKEEQKKAIKHLNESEYLDSNDVIKLIIQAISKKDDINAELSETLINFMPSEIKLIWEHLSQKEQKRFLSESIYFPINNKEDIANFWRTRNFTNTIYVQSMSENKKENNNNSVALFENKNDESYADYFNREWEKLHKKY